MLRKLLLLIVVFAHSAAAESLEGDYLYEVQTLRAAPGEFAALLDWFARLEDAGYYADAGIEAPLLMRHSQGDHWDLMAIFPLDNWLDFFAPDATARRTRAAQEHTALIAQRDDLIASQVDLFALGPDWSNLQKAHSGNGLYHIEMFEALAGRTDDLLAQRRMENRYLAATGQTPNMIFRRVAGSDVDVFTIGFHASLAAFAAPAPVTDEQKEIAAREAGFADRADIAFFLRALIAAHHDTLAVTVD